MDGGRGAPVTRASIVNAVEQSYFANLDGKNLEAALDCFRPDAVFTIQSAFSTHRGRDTGIREMLESLFERYERVLHKDFAHVIDVDAGSCASQFNVENVYHDGRVELLSNCNFFWFEGRMFKEVYVYMSGGANTLG